VIVTSHPLNYLPGVSVIRKVADADVVLWLDNIRYSTPGWQDRNVLPDGTQLTVPVVRESHRDRLRKVRIEGQGWAVDHAAHIERVFGEQPNYQPDIPRFIAGNDWSGQKLVDLSAGLLDLILPALGIDTVQRRQSEFKLGGHSIAEQLIRTIKALGGTTYLAAPNSHAYLSVPDFEKHGIELKFHAHEGPNPCCLSEVFQ